MSVVEVSDVGAAALFADKYCNQNDVYSIGDSGDGDSENRVKLIYYMNVGEVLSREINFKDTHSPKGDLLVVSRAALFPRVLYRCREGRVGSGL